jgi:hypothetical protein
MARVRKESDECLVKPNCCRRVQSPERRQWICVWTLSGAFPHLASGRSRPYPVGHAQPHLNLLFACKNGQGVVIVDDNDCAGDVSPCRKRQSQ